MGSFMQCLLPLPLPELSPTNALRNRLSIPFCFPTKQKHWLWPPGGPYTLNGQLLCAQSRPTLCDLLECSPPGSSVHGILQVRILVWGAISYFRGSSRPRDRTHVWIAGRFFTTGVTSSYCSWGSQGKNTDGVCHSLLQWTTFCQNSPPWPVRLGWPYAAWLIVSLS